MGADPVGRPLGPGRLGVGIARGPENGHEHLGLARVACAAVDDSDRAAGVIDLVRTLPEAMSSAAKRVRVPCRT